MNPETEFIIDLVVLCLAMVGSITWVVSGVLILMYRIEERRELKKILSNHYKSND